MDAASLTGLVGSLVGALIGIVGTLIGVAANERASSRAREDRALGAILRAIYSRRQVVEAGGDIPVDVDLLAAMREYLGTASRDHRVVANALLETRAEIVRKASGLEPSRALNALAARLSEWWSDTISDEQFLDALEAIREGRDSRPR